jgi:uncharacterized phage protein gp47/JayE
VTTIAPISSVQLQNVIAYLQQKIAEVDPTIDTRPNSGIGDVVLKPQDAILEPFAVLLLSILNNQSLLNAPNMTSTDLDQLVANVFITRLQGASASGTVRVFFSNPITITIPAASEFDSADGQAFFSVQDITITQNQMSLNKDGDFFYVDVFVQAETPGTAGNVAVGEIVDFVGGPSNILKVTNPSDFTGGIDQETNTALVARAAQAITVRDLVSKPAITTVLLNQFPQITNLKVVGYGDPEMERDFLIGTDMTLGLFPPVDFIGSTVGIHIGGKVDIYIRVVALTQQAIRISNIVQNVILRPQDIYDPGITPPNVMYLPLTQRPIIDVVSLQQIDPVTGDPIGSPLIQGVDYNFVVDNPTLRYSIRERNRLVILNGLVLGSTFLLTYNQSPDVVIVQAFVSNDKINRVVTADELVKFTTPAFVDLSVAFTLGPTATASAADIQAAITTFINQLDVGARLEVSDIVNLIYQNGGTFVQLPFTITATVLNPDGSTTVLTSNDFIQAPTTAAYLARNIVCTEV